MSFELPNLDRKTWQQLVQDLMRRIPQYTSQWTDYNDSDPGITLLQLLAWLDESLLYQANAIPLATQQNDLRWVLGLAFSSNQTAYSQAAIDNYDFAFLALQEVLAKVEAGVSLSATDLQKAVLSYVDHPYLALTLDNIETLARETNQMIAQNAGGTSTKPLLVANAYAQVAQEGSIAYILSDARPSYQFPIYPNQQQYQGSANTMRKLAMIVSNNNSAALQTLIKNVQQYLAARVIGGNVVRVRPAQRTDINLSITVLCAANTRIDVTLNEVFGKLFRYFLPLLGGPNNQGWEYDVAPVADAVQHLVLNVAGIEAISSFDMNYFPTIELSQTACLDVNAQLANLPSGTAGQFYHGLPRLRCLDITARGSQV